MNSELWTLDIWSLPTDVQQRGRTRSRSELDSRVNSLRSETYLQQTPEQSLLGLMDQSSSGVCLVDKMLSTSPSLHCSRRDLTSYRGLSSDTYRPYGPRASTRTLQTTLGDAQRDGPRSLFFYITSIMQHGEEQGEQDNILKRRHTPKEELRKRREMTSIANKYRPSIHHPHPRIPIDCHCLSHGKLCSPIGSHLDHFAFGWKVPAWHPGLFPWLPTLTARSVCRHAQGSTLLYLLLNVQRRETLCQAQRVTAMLCCAMLC
ncbi:hypothetical protein BDP55DRAFT_434768 [Colletotrichum godetiae]|uniref:Uncharacterized protein n=1 Tax=Colletotrichum godetiae TaxID=1209918 RepID=A0AAJ0AUV4_9PEZI|nr:uncharacterized protein BDP55DRAFT_434768 [Colletotrichum godetiae]KAK1689270.1 hypothetical protein BDP55DRAFT_434768 [Colletotrichum godetiae]